MDEFDEDFGDVDDEDMILAATQVERRISGLSQISASPSLASKRKRFDGIEDDIVDDGPSIPEGRDEGLILADEDDFDPAPYPIQPGPRNSSNASNDVAQRAQSISSIEGDDFDPPCHPTVARDTASAQKSFTQADVIKELEDLPSDAFSSSPLNDNKRRDAVYISSSQPLSSQQKRQRLVAPHIGLRQTTLHGGTVSDLGSQPQTNKRRNWPLMNTQEPPTHHKLDREALKTWVYPTNLGTIRDYQFNIVAKGLFHNLLVALPTGLGKTFIAATIMLNWLRWTTESQIVFVAPTKPLVSQQVDACFGIVGIPRSQTALLTGEMAPGYRAQEWASRRVLFLTPQTLNNDLKTGICDPKKIVCLVVDEAHRATGAYAYVEVVKFIRRFNQSFRVLALTATPGASVEKVQEVIDGLDLARVEIRTEESLDIRNYVHRRKVEMIVLDPSDNINMLMDLYAKALQPLLNKLNQQNAYWVRDPRSLTAYGLMKAQQEWRASNAGRNANQGLKFATFGLFTVLSSLAHPIGLLQYHGIGPFYHNLVAFRSEVEKQGNKGGKMRKQVVDDRNFQKLMDKTQTLLSDPTFIGHPKLEYLTGIVLKHFMDAGEDQGNNNDVSPLATRVMVFVHFRDSAEEVVRVLKRHAPMIRPTIFNGQATSKGGSAGMNQKEQLKTISDFQKGVFNTLVATSIGEEGLDIGEIDLIVCYDSSASPIRMLQRMGRTGRKRDGNIVLLLMRGKEADSWAKANDSYEKMQEEIASGDKFNYHEEISRRIVPRDIQPMVDKSIIEIPLENSQVDQEPKKRKGKPPKRPPKKFFMPDGVEAGFVKASRLREQDTEAHDGGTADERDAAVEEIDDIPRSEEVLLNSREEKDFERRYLNVAGGDLLVESPKLDAWAESQRSSSKTKYVKHGRTTRRVIKMLQNMRNMDEKRLACFEQNLHPGDEENALADLESSTSEMQPRSPSPKAHKRRRDASTKARGSHITKEPRGRDFPNWPRLQPSRTRSPVSRDENEDSDMDGFIVGDDDFGSFELSSTTSSPPPLDIPTKPFYTSPQRNVYQNSSSEDELPDVLALVRKEVDTSRDILAERSSMENLPPTASQRKGKRMIIQDSEDDGD